MEEVGPAHMVVVVVPPLMREMLYSDLNIEMANRVVGSCHSFASAFAYKMMLGVLSCSCNRRDFVVLANCP